MNSIEQFEPGNDVLVVDNDSSDATLSLIPESPNIIIKKNEKNIGFGKANNLGFKFALERNYDFVFLINQDAYLVEALTEKLASLISDEDNIGIVSPIQMNVTGKSVEVNFDKFCYQQSFYNKIVSDLIIHGYKKKYYPVEFIQAAAWFIPISTLNIIGGFDPIFFHYGEDNNYTQRVRFAGLSVVIHTESRICHDSNILNTHYPKNYNPYHLNRLKSNFYIEHANVLFQTDFDKINAQLSIEFRKLFVSLLKLRINKTIGVVKYIFFILNAKSSLVDIVNRNKLKGRNHLN